MITIQKFLKERDISFSTEKKALNWVRKLKPESLVRVGNSYFIDPKEMEKLLTEYVAKQILIRRRLKKQRSAQAKKNFKGKRKNPSSLQYETNVMS